jgi:hypothetical protein
MDAGWLTKVVVLLAVLGIAGVDCVSVLSARLSVHDDATGAAIAGRDANANSHDVMAAYTAALNRTHELHPDTQLPAQRFIVAGNGTVTATAVRTPGTILAHYLPWVRGHLQQSATERALPAT